MKKQMNLWLAGAAMATALAACSSSGSLSSPSGELTVALEADRQQCGPVSLTLSSGEQVLMQGIRLGMQTSQRDFADLRLLAQGQTAQHTESYRMLQGKRLQCESVSNDVRYTFVNAGGDTLLVDLRLSDDGLAFRYVLPGTAADEKVTADLTAYPIADGVRRWMAPYDIGYEQFFPLATDGSDVRPGQNGQWGYPALAEPVDGKFLLLTESDIRRQHCGSWLSNATTEGAPAASAAMTGERGDEGEGAGQQLYRIRLADGEQPCDGGAWTSPWRLVIAGSLATVVESTLVTDVAQPAVTTELPDWVQPAPVSWIYWAHNHGSRELRLIEEYIDLAVEMRWPYMLIDAEWDEMTQGDSVQTALQYARERGIRPMLWYNSCTGWVDGAPGPKWRLNRPEDRRREFQWLHDNGVAGIKVDFFGGDNILNMNYYHDLLEDALRYQLMVVLHGAVIPRGWQRTFPNLMTMEGVYGAEWYNNNGVLTSRAAAHNATLPFTRNVVGPMDYTPGTFTDSQHPHITSHCHELALTILFESALQHMPDRPSSYLSLPDEVRRLLETLPTAWEETRLIDGYPAHHAVVARRSGKTWYVAGINGTDEPLSLDVDLSALGLSKDSDATLFADGTQQTEFVISHPDVARGNALPVVCQPRGGFVLLVK